MQVHDLDDGESNVVDELIGEDGLDNATSNLEKAIASGKDGLIEGEGEAESPEGEILSDESEAEIVSLDEEAEPEENARPWVNDLRKRYREEQKRARQLEEQLKAVQGGAKVDALPKEPELEDFDYDADQFKAAYRDWTAKKVEHDRQKAKEREQQEEIQKQFQERQTLYATGKSRFPKDKMQEAEDEVVSILPQSRQSMLLDVADDPAALVATLGASPETLRKLSGIKSDAKFIKELTKVEMKIQSAPKKAPPPERTVSGSGRTPGASASNLDALYQKAQKSGDYTAYFAEKKRLSK